MKLKYKVSIKMKTAGNINLKYEYQSNWIIELIIELIKLIQII